MRKSISLLLLITLLTVNNLFAESKVVGYVTSWSSDLSQIQFNKLTHINFAFAIPSIEGKINYDDFESETLKELVQKAHKNSVKVLISVSGWNVGTEMKDDALWQGLSANPKARKTFVKEVTKLVLDYNLDGVDIYWAYPIGDASANNYSLLMQQLSESLHKNGKILSAAVAASPQQGVYVKDEVFGFVDYLNLMCYENPDTDSYSLDYAKNTLNYWLLRGLAKEKAIVGIPFHAKYSWESYRNIAKTLKANPSTGKFRGDVYDGPHQVQAKALLAKNHAGGVMVWEPTFDTDDQHSLLKLITDVNNGIINHNLNNTINGNAIPLHKEVLISEKDEQKAAIQKASIK